MTGFVTEYMAIETLYITTIDMQLNLLKRIE